MSGRLRGITFAKQFPNDAEPFRGSFTLQQVIATRPAVEWHVIAPLPWSPAWLAALRGRPHARGGSELAGVPVARPRYPVLPKRMLYSRVAPSMARASAEAFARIVREHEPQFVHAHTLYPSGAAARRLSGPAGLPLVVSVHGSDLHTNLVRPSWAAEVRATLEAAAAIVCVSTALADDVRALGWVDPDLVTVIPNTYDPVRFAYVERQPHEGPVRFVSVGNLVPVKGHDILVRGFARAVRNGLDATLDIVGGGPERERLARISSDEGVADRVRLRGALDGDALVALLAEADAFALASRKEGFGVAIVEALATGLPVLATRCGGPIDIVDEADGVLVAPEDPAALSDGLRSLADSLGTRDQHAIAARAAERYSPQRVGEQLVSLYRAAVAAAETGGGARA